MGVGGESRSFMTAVRVTWFAVSQFINRFTRHERWALLMFALVAIASLVGLGYERWLAGTYLVPTQGGIYTEGVVASSLADVTPTLSVLTKVGLARYSQDGQIVPSAATEWQVSDDGKIYTFALAPGVDPSVVRSILSDNEQLFPDIKIEVKEEGAVIFELKQPFTPFLATTTTPLFPYGPYQLAEQTKGIVTLKPNPQVIGQPPNLEEIVLRIYPDSFNLTQALSTGEIDGVSDTSQVETESLLRKLDIHQVQLQRSIYLFFNTEHESVSSVDRRRALKDGQPVAGEPTLTVVTLANPKHEQLAEQIVSAWSKLGVRVIVESHTATELAAEIVPKRAYDVLIYGLDFGGDPDPYPFWHSSQIGEQGLNLSNFANIDADRLLEKARQTQNAEERTKLYGQFQEIFDREVPAIELEEVVATYAVSQDVHGVISHRGLSVADRYAFVADWYRKTKRVPKE